MPCVAWTTAFFDRSCVGTVAAIAAGLGNAGGGATVSDASERSRRIEGPDWLL